LSAAAAPWAMMRDVPALGLTREHQQRWQQTADAARGVADAQRRLQDYWSEVLHEAAASFAARLAVPDAAVTPRSLYEAWIDCAEAAYARTAQDDLFCEALADYVNATSRWRTYFAAIVEHWSTLLDLPTRSEFNSLLRRLQSLERRLTSEPAAAAAAGPPCAAPPGTPP
jgi:class III poly(R)-hydroxyalkanoic acid synthase PhaE subunit